MDATTCESLKKNFEGKYCTILVSANLHLSVSNQTGLVSYFTGVVEDISASGILTTHPVTKMRNFHFWEFIVAICEEEFGEKTEKKHAAKPPEPRKKPDPPKPLINLDQLVQMQEKIKEKLQ